MQVVYVFPYNTLRVQGLRSADLRARIAQRRRARNFAPLLFNNHQSSVGYGSIGLAQLEKTGILKGKLASGQLFYFSFDVSTW